MIGNILKIMQAILDLNLEELECYLKSNGFPAFASRQIFPWIYKKGVSDFGRMTNLSRELRHFLKQNFYILNLNLIKKQISSDGTEKFLFALFDQGGIESVVIPMIKVFRNTFSGRKSLDIPAAGHLTACISTQAGCKFGCRFCASGAQGWQRDLTVGEIIGQVIYLKGKVSRRINNLVFMGIGEPLDNYDNVFKAVHILNSPNSLNIGARRMTVSTCGLIPGIERLANENLQVELSISLHAGDNQTRTYLMPINKRYPIEKLLAACRAYFKKTKRQITFEYVLIRDINTDVTQARKLAKLLKGFDAKVNLIPASPFRDKFSAPNKLEMLLFRDVLIKAGIPVTIRRQRGVDIQAACGQLRMRPNENR